MNKDIRILHHRRLVGEAIAWSLQFAYHYSAVCVQDLCELFEGITESSIILIDSIHFLQIPERGNMPQCSIIVLLNDIESHDAVEVLLAGASTLVDLSRGPEAVIEKVHQVMDSVTDDENVLIKKYLHLLNQSVFYLQPADNKFYKYWP